MTHNTGPSQNTRAQKRKLEEILSETPDDDEFELLCFELMTSLNSDEDVVKVMGADVPLAVQIVKTYRLYCSVVGRHLGCPRCTVIGTQCV